MQVIRRSTGTLPTVARMMDHFLTDEFLPTSVRGTTLWNNSMPAVNVKENNEQFDLELAAPGMEKKDFNIEVDQNVLTISSEKEAKEEENVAGLFTRREFSYHSFKRSFNLPETVDYGKIAASYKDGILSVVIPKKEEAKPQPVRKIAIG